MVPKIGTFLGQTFNFHFIYFSGDFSTLIHLLHPYCSSNLVNCNWQRSNNGDQSLRQKRETPSHGLDIFLQSLILTYHL